MNIRSVLPHPAFEGLLDPGEFVAGSKAVTVRLPTKEAYRMMGAFATKAVDAGLEVQAAYEEFLEHVALLNEGLDEEEDEDLILVAPKLRFFKASFASAAAAAPRRLN